MAEFLFSYSSSLDFAISDGDELFSSDCQAKEEMIKLVAGIWKELGDPILALLQDHLGLYYKRKEFEVVYCENIKRSVYHPVILQYGSYILEQRGKENWLKHQLNTLIVGAVHLLIHDHQTKNVQEKIDKFPFDTPYERNYVLYNSILKKIYDHFYPPRIINAARNGKMKNILDYIDEKNPDYLIQDTLGITIDGEFNPDKKLVKDVQLFFG